MKGLYEKRQNLSSLVTKAVFESLKETSPENAFFKGFLEYYGVNFEVKKAVFVGKCALSLFLGFRKFYKKIPSFVYGVGKERGFKEGNAIVRFGTHPLPSLKNIAICEEMVSFLKEDKGGSLFFISGGSSSLLFLPAIKASLKEIVEIEKQLLLKGAPIKEVNFVRMALSKLRGGGVSQIVKPYPFIGFIWCDVKKEDYKLVGSAPLGGIGVNVKKEAISILKKYEINTKIEIVDKKCNELSTNSIIPLFDGEKLVKKVITNLKKEQINAKEVKIKEGVYSEVAAKILSDKVKKAKEEMVFVTNGEFPVVVKRRGFGGRCSHLLLCLYKELKNKKNFFAIAIATDGCDGNFGSGGFIHSHIEIDEKEVKNHLEMFNSGKLLKKNCLLFERFESGNNLRDLVVISTEGS